MGLAAEVFKFLAKSGLLQPFFTASDYLDFMDNITAARVLPEDVIDALSCWHV